MSCCECVSCVSRARDNGFGFVRRNEYSNSNIVVETYVTEGYVRRMDFGMNESIIMNRR
jgi:transcription termination factor Rho